MDLGIAGKWALVCGASKGLGLGCAEAMAAEGVNLVVVARGAEALAQAAAADGSLWLFTSSQAVAHLAARLPRQDWRQARAMATHPRIAQAARDAGFGVVWESRPRLEEVVASIESLA